MKSLLTVAVVCVSMGLFAQTPVQELPTLNTKIIQYVDSHKGKKIDRGECWDVVNQALNYSGATWESPTGFGKEVDKAKIMAGDIVFMENVSFEWEFGSQSFPYHFAVVYDVGDGNEITLAHQNYNSVRKIRFDKVTLGYHTKGDLKFYRPQE